MAKPSEELMQFSRDLVEYNHRTATYYEDKRYRLLWVASAMIGFSATFIAIVKQGLLVYAGACSLLFAFLAMAYYAVFAVPTKGTKLAMGKLRFFEHSIDPSKTPEENYKKYHDKAVHLTPKGIVDENLAHAFALFYLCDPKVRSIKVMNALLLVGIAGFFAFTVAHFVSLI